MRKLTVKVIIVFVLLVLPLNALAVFQADSMIASTLDQIRMTEQNMLDVYADALETRMDNAASLLHYFRTEHPDCLSMTLQTERGYDYQNAKLKTYYSMKNLDNMIDGADGYFFYLPKVDDVLVCSSSYLSEDEVKPFLEDARSQDMPLFGGWALYEDGIKTYAVLWVSLKNISYGAWIDLDQIETSIRKGLSYESLTFSFRTEAPSEEEELTVCSKAGRLFLVLSVRQEELIKTHALWQRIQLVLAVIYLLLVPLLFLFTKRYLLGPLHQINDAHLQLQNGNQDYRLPARASSLEFEQANLSFNRMADNLKTLRIQNYEARIEKQQMELRNLQLQIRPHFLLNTFNQIYSLAQSGHKEAIQEIVLYLSEYFRYLFRSGRELELFSKELRLIEGYAAMAGFRYDGAVELDCDIDPEVEFVRMPPLLIHNFVENAVKYGLCQERILHISLQARYDNHTVTFTILDDGNGMDAATLDENRRILCGEHIPTDPTSHLGLYNSLKRLKYFYGETASIELASEEGEMTCFTITFPYDMEVDDDAFNRE